MTISTLHVASADGTGIGYLRQGAGSGLVLVQGAMANVSAYRDLAAELATSFTVYSVERRGRGMSPTSYDSRHDIARDVEDIDAVLEATGAEFVFGLSSGAVITLEAARALPRIASVAVYEPPFYCDGIDRTRVQRLFDELAEGDLPSALVDALLAAGTAPGVLRSAPRPIARLVAQLVLAVDDRIGPPRVRLRQLLPGVRFDFHDVRQQDGRIEEYASLQKPVLLLSGSKSPQFLRTAVRDLGRLLPHATHVELDGLGHDGPWNSGGPDQVAAALKAFFGHR